MDLQYDMCVDLDALQSIEEKLKRIGTSINDATEQMILALQTSQDFLAGQQYEKAQKTTLSCIDIAAQTTNNIRNAVAYLVQLEELLDAYNRCKYEEAGA